LDYHGEEAGEDN